LRLLGSLGVLVALAIGILIARKALRGRSALVVEQIIESGFLLLLAGTIAGPHATALVSQGVLSQLDPFFVLGLSSLGFVGGLRFDRGFFVGERRRLFVAASAQALLTMAIVGMPLVLAMALLWEEPLATRLSAGFCLGIAAAASSSWALRSAARRRPEGEREPLLRLASVASLDDFVVLLVLAVVFAALHAPPGAGGVRLSGLGWFGVTIGLGLVVGAVAWLLDGAVKKEAERPLFLLGCILLVGGMAFRLRLTPLVPAFVAGAFLANVAPEAAKRARATLERYEHPLLLAVLFLGGAAWVPFEARVSWLIPVWLILRVLGKVAGGILAARIAPPLPPRPGFGLLPSGAFGVAVAISFARAYEGNLVAPIVTTVVVGSLVSDAIGVFAWRDALVSEGPPTAPPPAAVASDVDATLLDLPVDPALPGGGAPTGGGAA